MNTLMPGLMQHPLRIALRARSSVKTSGMANAKKIVQSQATFSPGAGARLRLELTGSTRPGICPHTGEDLSLALTWLTMKKVVALLTAPATSTTKKTVIIVTIYMKSRLYLNSDGKTKLLFTLSNLFPNKRTVSYFFSDSDSFVKFVSSKKSQLSTCF